MSDVEYSEDPEPFERVPAGPLLVPVRSGPAGCSARLFRTPLGDRTAVGFTSEAGLAATLGPDHACVRLAEPALRALVAPLGVTALTVDPQFAAPAASKAARDEGAWRTWGPQHVGVLRVAGAAAVIACINLLIG
ncbi:SAV_915 family protein [Streptomyces tanashiensis]|uniref:SAV_915 family protein n=1 Tax=Streptomyces tanashiensis TaxID=67367 RepID=UPI0033F7BA2F